MRQSRVGWSNCREKGRIEAMKQCSFQSRLVKNSFYFAQELVSLSTAGIYRSLASRNSLLPSAKALKHIRNYPIEAELLKAVSDSNETVDSIAITLSRDMSDPRVIDKLLSLLQ